MFACDKKARHSSAYSRKSHARLQSERQQGRFYGSGDQQLLADADGSIILCYYWLLAGISHTDTDSYEITGVCCCRLPQTSPVRLTYGEEGEGRREMTARD